MNDVKLSVKHNHNIRLVIFVILILFNFKLLLLSFGYFKIHDKLHYFASLTDFILLKIFIYFIPVILLFFIVIISQFITNRILPSSDQVE